MGRVDGRVLVRGKHVLSRRSCCCSSGNGNTPDGVFVILVSEGLDIYNREVVCSLLSRRH